MTSATAEPDAPAPTGDGFDDAPDSLAGVDLTTAGIGEMLPGVLPPLTWGLAAHLVEEAFRRLLDDLGVLPEDVVGSRVLVRRVRGRAAMDFTRLRGMAAALPGSAGDQLEVEYFGSRRAGRQAAPHRPRSFGRVRSATHDLRVLRARQRVVFDAETVVVAAEALAETRPSLGDLDDRALLAYQLRLVDLAGRGTAAELGVAADATATYRRLQIMLSRQLGEVAAGTLADRLVAEIGVSATTPETSSAAVFAGPTWLELGREPPAPRHPADRAASEEQAMDQVLEAFRASQAWNESSFRTRLRLRAIRRLVHETTFRLSMREQAKGALLALGGEVRRVHLDAARRLVERGRLEETTDVDLLTPAELRGQLGGGVPLDVETIRHRRRWRARYEAEGPLPHRFSGTPDTVVVAPHLGRRLEGWAASGGRFRGRVQVVHSFDEDLEPDAVLVAEATDPSWNPLFMTAGAIVLDRGGPMSHAAILARELGVPAVLNVAGATAMLAGHEVTVDGDAGVVIVHDLGSTAGGDAR